MNLRLYCICRQKKLESDIDKLSQISNRLKDDLEDSERSRARLELTVQQLRASVRDLSDKLKTERDEVSNMSSGSCYLLVNDLSIILH